MGLSFFNGLISSYTGHMLKKHQAEKEQEINAASAQLSVLVDAAASGRVRPEYADAVRDRIDELQDEIAGKKSKGGFKLSNLIGKFQDTGQAQNQTKGGTGVSTQQAAPATTRATGGPSGTAPASVNLGVPPTRGTFGGVMAKGVKSPQEVAIEGQKSEFDEKIREFHSTAQSLSNDLFGQGIENLDPRQRQTVVRAAYSMPDAALHPITIDVDGRPVPALLTDDGAVIGPNGKRVEDPTVYIPDKASDWDYGRVAVGDNGVLVPVRLNKRTAEVFDLASGQKLQNPQLLPPAAYLPGTAESTTREPAVAVDAQGRVVVGPAITRKTTTTHAKAIPSRPGGPGTTPAAGPPSRVTVTGKTAPSPPGTPKTAVVAPSTPKRAGTLPWAEPKQLRGQRIQQMNETVGTFRKTLTDANKAVSDAQKQLNALQKEQRGEGIIKGVEHLAGIGGTPDVAAGQRAVLAAQRKATNTKRAVDYLESMRQSVVDGVVDVETVERQAQELADTGSVTRPPGNVTRRIR